MQAERRVLEAKHEYDHVCKLVKTEVARFEQERIDDFKDSLHAFLEGMISRQKEVRLHLSLFACCFFRLFPFSRAHVLMQCEPFSFLTIQLITVWENYQQMLLKRVGGAGGGATVPAQGVMS